MDNQSMAYFNEFNKHALLELDKAHEQGVKIAGLYCIFGPTELIRAAGAIPVGLCGKKQEPIQEAEKTLPANLCPLIKSSYGFAAGNTCPFFSFSDFIIGETTCDGKKKMFELLDEIKPTYVMQLPYRTLGDSPLAYWTTEIHRLKAYLEEQTGNTIAPEKLNHEIKLQNRINLLVQEIALFMKEPDSPITGPELLKILETKGYAVDLEKYAEDLTALKAELEEKRANMAKNDTKPPRILITGCPSGTGSDKVTRLAQECGALVVCQENCTGVKGLYYPTLEDAEDPFAALAERYLKVPCSCTTPNTGRLDLVGKLAQEYKIDGVIDLTWTCCHTYNVESFSVENFLDKKLDLPMLQIETDYSESDSEQIRTRLEAFLEML